MNLRIAQPTLPLWQISCVIFLFLALLYLPLFLSAHQPQTSPNSYAVSSRTFDLDDFGKPKARVFSPDGAKSIRMTKGGKFAVFQGSHSVTEISAEDLSGNIEIGWSPDSTQFFIRWSNGGAIGIFRLRIFQFEHGTVTELSAPQSAYAHFKNKHFCPERGMNNEFALGWTQDSKQLFLVLEVYSTGDCAEASLFRGYLLNASTGKIQKVFGERATDVIKKNSRQAGFVVLPPEESPARRS